jgi:multidrug efflux pump subunit AcrA (membrane-fusion protein)
MPTLSFQRPGANQFTAEQRASAQLPAPAHEGSDVDILLRPGLLADAEIIIENIPNVVYIPYQAVFNQGGNPVVYALNRDRFEARRVKLGQRSESQIVILEGLEEGETIALESPDASAQQDRAKKKKKSAGGDSQPSFPGGGSPGGGGGGPR